MATADQSAAIALLRSFKDQEEDLQAEDLCKVMAAVVFDCGCQARPAACPAGPKIPPGVNRKIGKCVVLYHLKACETPGRPGCDWAFTHATCTQFGNKMGDFEFWCHVPPSVPE